MKSLRQLTKELTGIRLHATNISLWAVTAVVDEYARLAINDAISIFPTTIEMVYTSGVVSDGIVVLPRRVGKVVFVEDCGGTPPRRTIEQWRLYATPSTVFLRVYGGFDGRLDITYLHRQSPLPPDICVVKDSFTIMTTSSGWEPAESWPAEGFFEISNQLKVGGVPGTTQPTQREVVYYTNVWWSSAPTAIGGFQQLTREVEGMRASGGWLPMYPISACCANPEEDLRPVMLMAQAVMYEFWLRHRALYEQYTSLASMQALGLEDLQLLIRDLEARARLDYEARQQRLGGRR